MTTQPSASSDAAAQRSAWAPVVLFVHSRADHMQRTIDALAANHGASETELFICVDAARSPREAPAVDAVRALAHSVTGFKSVEVIERAENFGLARNIVDGVTRTIERFGQAIVLEDDIVTAPQFLAFMNAALDRYADEPQVWHINGWTYPVETQTENRAFFTPLMECWGWATWADRWKHFDRDPSRFLGKWDRKAIRRFNVEGGYDYWGDIRRNAEGSVRTWAVFWYATMFEQGGLCLTPPQSYAVNIGIDGSGQNSGTRDIFAGVVLAEGALPEWPRAIEADEHAWGVTRDFLLAQRPWLGRRLASQLKWRVKGLLSRA